jgi:hypothetical protein
MSWLFSRVLVEEYSAAYDSGGEPSVQLSVISTPQPFWYRDKTTDFSRLSRFGLTWKHLTVDRGEELLTWFRAGFRVRTSAQPDAGQELTVNDRDCGESLHESLAMYDPDLRSWKTLQCSLFGVLAEFSGTWPCWGTMRDGVCWGRKTPSFILAIHVRITNGKGFGFWPTPRAQESGKWQWNGSRNKKMLTLSGKVDKFPTPTARDSKSGAGRQPNGHTPQLAEVIGGQLNPNWVEWLMGWPIGWTELEPLGTDKFQQWLRSHGKF